MRLFHKETLSGMCSNALRSTRAFAASSFSRDAALIHSCTLRGIVVTPRARMSAASAGCESLAASSHTSSFCGHASHPFLMRFLAAETFPATSSSLAAAIHPGPCPGLVATMLFKSSLAFFRSATSASDLSLIPCRSVRYPFGSTTVCPETLSDARSSCKESTVPLPSATEVKSADADALSPSSLPPTVAFKTAGSSCAREAFSAAALASSVSGGGANFSSFCFLTV
mmetsp:Transcript_7194/g.44643  ORF Transcript_7194/g.44643 Transcript_7194/m.44643 type:complete len:227 (+) Transcript_7194:6124-6804(+)